MKREVKCPECLGCGYHGAHGEETTACSHCGGHGTLTVERPAVEPAQLEPWVFRASPQVKVDVDVSAQALMLRVYVDLGFRIVREIFCVIPLQITHSPDIVIEFTRDWCAWGEPDPLRVTTFDKVAKDSDGEVFWIVDIMRLERDDEGKPLEYKSLSTALIEQGICQRVEGFEELN